MHGNGTAPLEASPLEASTSAYSRITVQLQEATENVFAKTHHPACCILMMLSSIVCARYIFDLENVVNYKKTPVDPYLNLT